MTPPSRRAGIGRRAGTSATNIADAESPLLIVNADDFGLSAAVCRATITAHRDGIVTSVSVLAVAPGFNAGAEMLGDAPRLGVGAHLAAVGEDPPLLTAREIPTLVDRHGRFALDWRHLVPSLVLNRVDPADLHREFSAQIDKVASIGRPVDHLNTHQHVHLWPGIADVVVRLAAERSIPVVRRPWSRTRGPKGAGVRILAKRLAGRCADAGISYPSTAAGLDEVGAMTTSTMLRTLELLRAEATSSAEMSLHPSQPNDPDRDRYRWWNRHGEDEIAAACSVTVRVTTQRLGFRLGSFADLATASRC